jgi:hypothetical protein
MLVLADLLQLVSLLCLLVQTKVQGLRPFLDARQDQLLVYGVRLHIFDSCLDQLGNRQPLPLLLAKTR